MNKCKGCSKLEECEYIDWEGYLCLNCRRDRNEELRNKLRNRHDSKAVFLLRILDDFSTRLRNLEDKKIVSPI